MLAGLPRFVSAQPDTPWFVWQTHVYVRSLLDLDVPADLITALFSVEPDEAPTPELVGLQERFPEIDVQVFADGRTERGRRYEPSIQPHLIERWLRANPERADQLTFFHDSDIAFRWLPDFAAMVDEHPDTCLLSDADEYIGFDYLTGVCDKIQAERPEIADDHLIDRMCAVVGIDRAMVRSHKGQSGGAQYLLPGTDPNYWAKVYDDSLALRELFDDYATELELEHESAHYLQVWTAGMWAYLWNLWAAGRHTVVRPDLNHLFGAHDLDDTSPIMHMAGKTLPHQSGRFDKVDWHGLDPIEAIRRQPYAFDHHDDGSVAATYGEVIRAAAGVEAAEFADLSPARHWRVLSWCVDRTDLWDVEFVHFGFDDAEAEVVHRTSSGSAGPGFEADLAFIDDHRFWGGRPHHRPPCRPEFFLGVELDRPAAPVVITLDQAASQHRSYMVLVQKSDDGHDWRTVRSVPLAADGGTEVVLYRSPDGRPAPALRLIADGTSSGFAWDVTGAAFLADGVDTQPGFEGSGDAGEGFGADRLSESGTWGGRADAEGRFHLTATDFDDAVDRIVLEQGDDHWTPAVTLERRVDEGAWETLARFDDLVPGRNVLFLADAPPRFSRPHPIEEEAAPEEPVPTGPDPFADRRVLVAIASYRDADVANTVANALAQAAYPEHLRFSICNQFDDATQHVLDPWADDPRFAIDLVPHQESGGCCWARHRTYEAFDDEPYLLQIDAHTRFAARWDVRFIEMLEGTGADLPLLTTYPPGFRRADDGSEDYQLDVGVQSLYIDELRDDLTTLQKTDVVRDLSAPGPSPTIAAGLVFTRGRFCRDVPYDPDLYFAGEEISLAARAFTSGYDLFHPNVNLVWHRYGHDEPKHWEDHDTSAEQHRGAVDRLHTLFRGEHRTLAPYGLGSVRPLAAFERHAGIRLRPARTGDALTVEIAHEVIAPRDDYDAFVVALLDVHGTEIARREIRDPAVLDRSRSTVTLHDLGDELADAVDYLVVPTQRNGAIGEVIRRSI